MNFRMVCEFQIISYFVFISYFVPLMILTPTIEPGIEYKNKNVTKDMPSLFETYFWERIKNTEPRTKNSPFL